MIARIGYYASWIVRCKFLGQRIPLTSSLIITDRCNLSCKHCTVSNLGYRRLAFSEIADDIRRLHEAGSRVLIITGGEPFLWRDGDHDLESAVSFARNLGFFRVVVCTNGTFPLESTADLIWVSLDGLPDTHNFIRSEVFDRVWGNIQASKHKRLYINLTVSKLNVDSFEDATLHMLECTRIRGVMFHIFTPYIGSADLSLSQEERRRAADRMLRLKRRHPWRITNTFDGLKALRDNHWHRPVWSAVVVNQGEMSTCCCRNGISNPDVCRECGCTPAIETWVLQRLRPLAIIENLRFLR